MKPELIVMLTHHDETVKNAFQIFAEVSELPIRYWGFKDVGLPPEQMKNLVRKMKDAGKTTCLEVVSLSEDEGLRGAAISVDAGFDILMGTVYFESIRAFLKGKPVKYFPFPGHVYGHPSILDGTIGEIVAHARFLEARGVDGMDLLAYRYVGDAHQLLCEVVRATSIPIISAGSIATFQRIAEVWATQAWGFTIGSAFFDGKIVPGAGFKENLVAVWEWMEKMDESQLAIYQTS